MTGSTGFIGRALGPLLIQRGHSVTGWSRRSGWFDLSRPPAEFEQTWAQHLRDTDTVIHLAAHVHMLDGSDIEQHRQINCHGTLRLASAAIAAGVKQFIFISTAKVFGEGDSGPYSPRSEALPQDAYAISKWEAEQGLLQLCEHAAMQLVIIRPPLVYGAGVGANFARLIRLASLPIPLPVASIDNRRDMIGIDNLVDLIATCVDTPVDAAFASGSVLLCSDGHPYSLPEVIATIRRVQGRSANLFSLPASWIHGLATAALGEAASRRLFGNFELDITETRKLLDWRPPLTMEAILRAALSHNRLKLH